MADRKPVAVVVIGMAGSGKTTFMQRINAHLHQHRQTPYVINLDPAVHKVPFESNIDIRDSVKYKEVMKQYNLGPNGGILTSLNLFATKVDQIINILEKRTATAPDSAATASGSNSGTAQQPHINHILVDTPGQIEVFVWSASGDILLGSLASSFPTVVAYVIDTPRSASTSTFMSNMLYACSILYKTKLPMILVFNKTDVRDAGFAEEWMTDFEAFQAALRREEEEGSFGGADGGEGGNAGGFVGSGYMGSLLHSMSLVLDEFYKHLKIVAVSSVTGAGIDEFFKVVEEKRDEFERDYKPELERRRKERDEAKDQLKTEELQRRVGDLDIGGKGKRREEPETVSDMEDEEDDDESDEDTEEGLSKRYKQALEESSGATNEDMSFLKYLHTTNVE